jgi:DNA-binding winged helix-turn-helix (wHTH) protein
MRVRFFDCVLDTDARQLRRAGEIVHLPLKAYELLRVLVGARPRALSKNELYAHLWPDTFVVEANLANLIADIRSAVGDRAHEPRIIRTVHGFGYAFAAEAHEELADVPAFTRSCLVWHGRRLPLVRGENVVGRDPDAQVRFDTPGVSRKHAIVTVTERATTIEDLGSKNGTRIGNRRIAGPTPLHDGDAIQLGSIRVTFRDGSAGVGGDLPPARIPAKKLQFP